MLFGRRAVPFRTTPDMLGTERAPMPYNIRIVSTYPPRRCGIGPFSRDLATACSHFTSEVGHIRVAAIDNGSGPYDIPVDLVIDQYNPESWREAITHISTRAGVQPHEVLSVPS
jgi:hypothetical protein